MLPQQEQVNLGFEFIFLQGCPHSLIDEVKEMALDLEHLLGERDLSLRADTLTERQEELCVPSALVGRKKMKFDGQQAWPRQQFLVQ